MNGKEKGGGGIFGWWDQAGLRKAMAYVGSF